MFYTVTKVLVFCFLFWHSSGRILNSQTLNGIFTISDVINIFENCELRLVDSNAISKIKEFVENGAQVININLSFQNFSKRLRNEHESSSVKPLTWVRTTSRHGRNLLLLRSHYEILSLTSLSLGTEKITVTLQQIPSNCLTNRNTSDITKALGLLLVSNFNTQLFLNNSANREDFLKDTEHVCNLNVGSNDGTAEFYYVGCNKKVNGEIECKELKADIYITILHVCILIANFVAVCFSPLLVPSRLYRDRFKTMVYEHALMKPITMSIRKTDEDNDVENVCVVSNLDLMTKFVDAIENVKSDFEKFTLRKIDILVKADQLISSTNVPVGLFKSLYSALVNCKIRKKPSIQDCCDASLLDPCNNKLTWYNCLRQIMHFVVYVFIALIWVFRYLFFLNFEQTDRNEKNVAANLRNLEFPFTDSLTWYLSPTHSLFWVIYVICVIDIVLFGCCLKFLNKPLQRVVKKCFRDMREMPRTTVFGWCVQILICPCRRNGMLGILYVPLYYIAALPVVTLTLAFYCLPTINILIRLIVYFVAYLVPYVPGCLTTTCCACRKKIWRYIKKRFRMDILTKMESIERPKEISIPNRIIQLVVIFLCLFTIFSIGLLSVECIVFLVEIAIYTMIGLIINASVILRYLTLAFLLLFYARDCFNSVETEYLTFNKFLNGYIVNKMREKVNKITKQNKQFKKNTAFQVSQEDTTGKDDKTVSLVVENGELKWRTHKLILFLDEKDTPCITSNFFFNACYLELAGVPGPLLTSLLRALRMFVFICIFLFFVVIVILAFGDGYGISSTNQLFATLAGGFLPYILKSVLLKQPEQVTVDPENLSFQNTLQQIIEDYTENWDVADLTIEKLSLDNDINVSENDTLSTNANQQSEGETVMLEDITPSVERKISFNVQHSDQSYEQDASEQSGLTVNTGEEKVVKIRVKMTPESKKKSYVEIKQLDNYQSLPLLY